MLDIFALLKPSGPLRGAASWFVALVVLLVLILTISTGPLHLSRLMDRGAQHDGRTTREWLSRLDNPATRLEAIEALGAIGPDAPDAVDPIARLVREEPETTMRIAAARALHRMVPASKVALPTLIAALNDPEPWVRLNAILALNRLRDDAMPAREAVLAALGDPANRQFIAGFHVTLEERLAGLAGRLTAGTGMAVAPIADCLGRCKDQIGTAVVVQALGFVGPPAQGKLALIEACRPGAGQNLVEAINEAVASITMHR